MTLTTSELRDMVAMAMVSRLRETEGTCALEVDTICDLIEWVNHYDFEEALEVIRGDY